MLKKKVVTLIILGLGVAMILAGACVMFQSDAYHTGYGGGVSRASTSIKFGGDFYTTSAQYTGLAANTVTDLYQLTSIVTGIFFVFVGGMDICVTLLLTDIRELFDKKKPVEAEAPDCNITE